MRCSRSGAGWRYAGLALLALGTATGAKVAIDHRDKRVLDQQMTALATLDRPRAPEQQPSLKDRCYNAEFAGKNKLTCAALVQTK